MKTRDLNMDEKLKWNNVDGIMWSNIHSISTNHSLLILIIVFSNLTHVILVLLKFKIVLVNVISGELDNATITMMQHPRCGLPDNKNQDPLKRRRKKRFSLHGTKYATTDITYRITKYTPKVERRYVDAEIARALQVLATSCKYN